jgi:hypothetical protein
MTHDNDQQRKASLSREAGDAATVAATALQNLNRAMAKSENS